MTPTPSHGPASVGDGRYTLSERIAVGGMGEVWRALDTVLGRDVAVKILKAEYAEDATFRARFQAEARNTAALHHPGIAQVFDFGDIDDADSARGTTYLVMELVPGEPLSALLTREGALPADRAVDIVVQSATAIDVAHRQGIVHRDVKPANLLVTPAGTVKVTDFGIARAADAVPLTDTGEVIGTPHYLSPEQASGNPATPASDVYALGIVLYECLTGSRPFEADSPVAVAMHHLRDEPPDLPGFVAPALAAVCMQALAKDPGMRPQSAGVFADRVRRPDSAPVAPQDTKVWGPPAGEPSGESSREDTALITAPGGTPPSEPHDRRRRGWLVPAAAAVAVLLLAGVLGLALADDDGSGSAGTEPRDKPTPKPTPVTTEPSPEPSPELVRVNPAEYRGQPFEVAGAQLRADGLRVRRTERFGVKGEPGTVAYVEPHGPLAPGATVTLGVWRTPPGERDDADSSKPGKGDDTAKPTDEPRETKQPKGKAKGHRGSENSGKPNELGED